MPNLARQSYKVSVFVATVVIAAQNLAIQYSEVVKRYFSPSWLGLMVTAGITSILFRLIVYFYEKTAWRWFNRDIVLAGKWKHKLTPADSNPNPDRDGEFVITQTAFETKIVSGKNYNQETGRISSWRSLAVFDDEVPDRSLWVIYEIERGEAMRVGGESEIDRGLIRVHLDVEERTGRMTRMFGSYWDAGTSQHKGSFAAELSGPELTKA